MVRTLHHGRLRSGSAGRVADDFRRVRSSERMRTFLSSGLPALILLCATEISSFALPDVPAVNQVVTNVAQFRAMPIQDFLRTLSFHLTGTITLVDTNRKLLVLQDPTGAMAMSLSEADLDLRAGQRVSVDGTNAVPYLANF